MPAWNRDSDRALDAELRAARPKPSPEVTRAIADRVRPRETAGKQRFGRLHLALAGGLTALVLTPVVATGFGGIGSFGKTTKTKASTKHGVAYLSKARSARALGSLSGNRKLALWSLAGGTPSTAAMAPTGGPRLATQDSASAFLGDIGDIFQPQNDVAATQEVYEENCEIDTVIQENNATLTQGGNTATGGNATATGGAGGDASTGNTQTDNGNVDGTSGGDNTIVSGGDTTADSGDATGGDGGDAVAIGGDAEASNEAEQTLINVICVDGE